ncbi:helix-turn-helix transcriptional regulator [Saccharothrix violaceirubra]|uniref:Transcriptional regulator with XRE-family HTH domain n=1 Tax=Saccharothrix violaceirubra TaxID=413306 RepID=A0A7W7WUM0_9PSEU|nr:helix-turn-helix transcriptional regulator [Saccharothrix violaceirubra]MBB4963543.1 transcriptional regulator with XRE-family HTH domain [Saccharothrix violaceirubra]
MTEQPRLQLPPAVMKVVLGRQLARLRENAGRTQEDAAGALGCTQKKISHVEGGSGISLPELDVLLDRFGAADSDRDYARALQAESDNRRKKGAFSTRFPEHLRLLVDMEPSCDRYSSYQAMFVPGLLQTEAYMRMNLRAWRPSLSREHADASVTNRLARQRVLDNLHQRFWFIVDEAALRRASDPAVLREQVRHLVDHVLDRPNVEFQVVPFDVGFYMGQGRPYSIFGYDTTPTVDIIYLEHDEGGEYVDHSKRTVRYLTRWDYQRATALGPEQSRRLLLDLAAGSATKGSTK